MFTIWAFHQIENKHSLYCQKDCIKNFCESLREHSKHITNFEKNNMLPLTKRGTKTTSRCNRMLNL